MEGTALGPRDAVPDRRVCGYCAGRTVRDRRAAGSLLGRVIRPEEIAHLVTYLSSDFASATTGRALGADGGLVPTIIP